MKNLKKLIEEVRFAELKKIKRYNDHASNKRKIASQEDQQVA